jgi:hypothetical protein
VSVAAVVTIVAALVTVVVLAGFLIQVALVLSRVERRLREVVAGVEIINERAAPAGPVVLEINQVLDGVLKALQGVLGKRRGGAVTASRPPAQAAKRPSWL